MKKMILLLTCLIIGMGWAIAQNKQVSGTVVDEAGEPVIGASVVVKGYATIGANTDLNGKFTLQVPESANTLIVKYLGMQEQEVAVAPNVSVTMHSSASELDEVIVVAFGTAKKSAFTGSAKVVSAKELEKSQVTSVTNALSGAVPGLQLTSSNGAPGATSVIKIRGFSSLNAGNNPLIIVDGAPYSGDLSNLNPNDVESMTVLKDAASNALYGARGANGVIMITTKKADKSGDAVITFDAKYGTNSRALQQYNIITNPAQYYETHYGALSKYYVNQGMAQQQAWQQANANLFGDQGNGGLGYNVYTYPAGQMLIGLNGKLNPSATLGRTVTYRGEDYYLTPDDWENVGTRDGIRQEYNFSVNGGSSNKSSFYASLGWLDNQGITTASSLERLTARLRADSQVKEWMKVGGTMSYTKFEHNSLSNNGSSTSSGNIWAFTSQMAPIYPAYIRTADGNVKIDGNGFGVMDYGNGTNAGMSRPFISDANPIMDSQLNTNNHEGNAATGNGFMDLVFFPGFKITLNGTYNLDETRGTYVYNPYYGQFDTTGGTVSKYHGRTYDYNLQQLVNYTKTIAGDHNLEILLGHEYYNYMYAELSASKSKMFSQDNKELGGAVLDGQDAYSYRSTRNNEGYFSRLQYNFDERIFASASFRRDASSRFHPDYRWGNFWSVGGAWLINKEGWLDASWVDELKIKASYGVQGNDDIGLYRYTDVFDIVNSAGSIGTSFAAKGTKDITWETNANFNIGTEFQLFDRITASLEYYHRNTTNMLFSFTVAPSLGYSSYYDNIGDMYNTGVELDLGVNILKLRDFTWDVNFNISTLKNRITMLHEDKKTSSLYDANGKEYKGYNLESYFVAEDLSILSWRLKDYAGLSEDGQSMWYKNTKDDEDNITGRETTTAYADADYYATNETALPKVFGGFGTTLQSHGVDFSINCSYQIGGKQYDGTYAQFMSPPVASNTGYNFHADVLKAWTPENTSSDIPRFVFGDTYGAAASTRFLTDASYLNIENINLGYTFPAKWTKKIFVNSLRLYVAGENIFYWSKRTGFDPRQAYSSTTTSNIYSMTPNATYYSPMRTLSGGVTIQF
ncbi:MAG: SusC/RagA family TonB-linked outer membrane protein [Dysgonamonadaceae bacterium]|jgi:TonB-linked SusC/RagA family outer membrane protein|nr:SusC/RagA family TonB-linked outer membrane protein [Dysgonamonadaceae bacterium]